jgi:putative CocE/NonD family hydrolase
VRLITEFPHRVIEEETWIRMPDGCRLGARIWRPVDPTPVPAILEYLPYRKRDLTAERDAQNHAYFAGHGYAGVRVDLRGSGDSDGVLEDEYTQQEFEDGLAVLRWLAEQPWCTGDVGMIGISWGGFNGLQIASLRPPELKAVITLCSTDDRYADDVHHMGGCLLGDNLSWASTMLDQNACPPDPALVGERWREMWLERLAGSGLWLEKWLRHQRRDDYFRHGSVCEDYGAIQCPVLAVSGWADGYCNAVFRLLEGLRVPRRGLVGPWAHTYPHLGVPGPAIGFLQECRRWFDHWLKGVDTGLMDEPMLRVWMQDSVPPSTYYAHRPGRWVAEPTWPSDAIRPTSLKLTPGHRLVAADVEIAEAELSIQSPLFVGLYGGKWCSYTAPPDLPHDQRDEDGGAIVFQTEALQEPLEILGQPRATLVLAVDQPVAMLAARLIDIQPDGKATRVSYGLLNLTHRDSDARPTALEPGRRYRVTMRLKHIAQRFPAGHAIRLSISTVYWPIAWPAPAPVNLTLFTGSSQLTLPVRPPRDADDQLRRFDEPEAAPPPTKTIIQPARTHWTVMRDLANDRNVLEVLNDRGTWRLEQIDLELSAKVTERYSYERDDHQSLKGWCEWVRSFRRGDWSVRMESRTLLTADPTHFRIRATLDAFEGDSRLFARSWDTSIPRDLV